MVFTAEGGGLTIVSPIGTNGDFSSMKGTVKFMTQTQPINTFTEGDVVKLPGVEGGSRITIQRISDSGVTVNGFGSFPPHTIISGQSPAILVESVRNHHYKGEELLEVPVKGAELLDMPAGADLLELPEPPPDGWELLGDPEPTGFDLLS